jgi:Family of unknown function (DUF6169)
LDLSRTLPSHSLQGQYFFISDSGNNYLIGHELRDDLITEIKGPFNFYELSLLRDGNENEPKDSLVIPTITDIVKKLIENIPDSVHFYICDMADNRHRSRSRRFDAMYKSLKKKYPFPFEKIDIVIPAIEGDQIKEYLVSILIHDEFPQRDKCLFMLGKFFIDTHGKKVIINGNLP